MCTALLPCPLCSQPFFKTLETLRIGLIKVATENLACPVCHDTFMGLDKLTIHLFSHCNDTCEAINKTEEYAAAGYQEKADEISENIGMKIEGPLSGQNFEGTTFKIDKRKDKNVALGALGKSGRKPNKAQNKMNNINDGVTNSNATIKSLPKFPIYNMNSLPFIGIPKPIRDASNSEDNSRSDANGSINQDCLSERCEICGFYFLGKNILEMHRKIIHNVQENGSAKYSCHLCSKVFKMRGSLMVHLRMVHFGMVPSDSGHDGSLSSCNEMQDVKNNNVLVEQGNNLSPFDEKIASPQDGAEIENNGNNKQWECDICRKLFTTKYFLKKHKRLHTGEMPYSCAQCNKTFTFQQSYHKHLLYHNDDKPHTCSQCGRAFKELSTLHNHQRIHTGEKPFSCESCGKCFRQRVSYLVHRRIHTGVMPYKCTACEKSFRYKVSQRTHKCTAQPPGTVIRQSGDLVQKLIQNHIETAKETVENNNNGMTQPNEDEKFNTVYGSEAMMLRNENKFNQSIGMMDLDNTLKSCRSKKMNMNENFSDEEKTNILDEIVNQSLLKMNFANSGGTSSSSVYQDSNVTDLYSMMSPQHTAMHEENSLPSPSDKLKELKLSSPNEDGIENILSEGLFEKNDGMNDLFQNDQSDKLNGGFSKIMTGYPDCGSMNFQNALYDQTYNT